MVIGDIANAIVNVFGILVDVLLELWSMAIIAAHEILDYQRSQPVAFMLMVGGLLVIFILTPFIFDFTWNTVLFGSTAYTGVELSTTVFVSELTPAQRAAVLNNMDLVKVSSNATTNLLKSLETPYVVQFGPTDIVAVTPASHIVINSWVRGSKEFQEVQLQECATLATTGSNTSAWEGMLMFSEPEWVKLLQLSIENPELREQEVWMSCYEVETDATTEIVLPGTTFTEKNGNLTMFIQNGSICEDEPFKKMALEAMDPFREGGIINPTSPFYQNLLGGAVLAYEGVKNFLFAQNLSSITPTAPIGCYVMVNRTSRQRYYKGEPRWLTDQGGDSDIAASLFYRNLMLEQPKVPASKWKSLEAIEVSTPVEFKPGVFSFLEMPFQELERVTNILTLDQTKKYWDMAREIATGLLILIIGLIGVALILNTRN